MPTGPLPRPLKVATVQSFLQQLLLLHLLQHLHLPLQRLHLHQRLHQLPLLWLPR